MDEDWARDLCSLYLKFSSSSRSPKYLLLSPGSAPKVCLDLMPKTPSAWKTTCCTAAGLVLSGGPFLLANPAAFKKILGLIGFDSYY